MTIFKKEALKHWDLNNIDTIHEQYYRQCLICEDKSYIEVAYLLSIITKTVLDRFIELHKDFNEIDLKTTIVRCPTIAPFKDAIYAKKHKILRVFSPDKQTAYDNLLGYVDAREYCFSKCILPINFFGKLYFCCPSMDVYNTISESFATKSREDTVVTWCEINSIEPKFAIASKAYIEKAISNYQHYLESVDKVELHLDNLPEILQPVGQILSYCERNYIHNLNITISKKEIESIQYQYSNNRDVTVLPDVNKVDLYYSLISLLSYLNMSYSDLHTTPMSSMLNILNVSTHTESDSEIGLVVHSSPVNKGFSISFDLIFSCEIEKVLNDYPIPKDEIPYKPITIFFKNDDNYKSTFYHYLSTLFINNKMVDTLLISENFPLVIGDSRSVSGAMLSSKSLRSYVAAGFNNLIIGEINSPELAKIAILASLVGINIVGTMNIKSSQFCKANLKRLVLISDIPNPQGLGIDEMVQTVSKVNGELNYD